MYDEIETLGHPQPAIYPLNLQTATLHDYQTLAQQLEQEFSQLDGLLHNAAILGVRTPLQLYDPEMWQQVMQVNSNAPFYITRALLPLLNLSTDASIIFTSSSVGRSGRAYWGAYSVSKFAVEGMMQIFADELENTSNIRVNSLNPGATRTNMRARAYPAENPDNNPTAEDIMPAYLYLMGKDSHDINGQALNVHE